MFAVFRKNRTFASRLLSRRYKSLELSVLIARKMGG